MWIVRHRVVVDGAAPSKARRFVNRCVRGRTRVDRIDDVLLVTSELVTNAVEHGAAPVTVDVSCEDTAVSIAVHDGGNQQPDVRRLGHPTAEGGTGLTIVDALADAWGVTREPSGKTVWFRFDAESGDSSPPTPPPAS